MQGWQVCLLLFALNASTRFISPTKALEYMTAKNPIVSTVVHGVVRLYGNQIRIASDAGSFNAMCWAALAEDTAQPWMRIAAMRAAVPGRWRARRRTLVRPAREMKLSVADAAGCRFRREGHDVICIDRVSTSRGEEQRRSSS